MKLSTTLFGQRIAFKDVKDVLAKANEQRSGDVLAGVAAHNARERVAALGGRLEVDSSPGRGTEIRASFPLP